MQTKLNLKHRVTKYRKSNSGGRSPAVEAQVPSADLHGIDLGAMKKHWRKLRKDKNKKAHQKQ